MEYKIHPAAEIFPAMSDGEFEGLANDIERHGLREPIILYEGKILDGRHRYRACRELGLDPRFEDWSNGEAPESYVVSKNLHRRHLNTSQRAMVAARIANLSQGRPKPADRPVYETQAEVAQKLNVGERTVRRAKQILRDGAPEEVAAVDSGKKTIESVVPSIGTGPRIRVPEGLTLEDHCRNGMALEEDGLSTDEAALKLGMNGQNYRMARDIVVLSDKDDLSARDMEAVQAALDYINAENRVSKTYDTVKPIVKKVFGTKPRDAKSRNRSIEKRLAEFEHAVYMLVDMSRNLDQIEIPHLDETHTADALRHVREAERNIRQFRNKLEGFNQ